MPDTDLKPFSVTDGKISNQAKINPKKIAPANEASVLIAQSDRKYQPKTIYGDATLAADGKLTIDESKLKVTSTTTATVESETIPEGKVKVGSNYVTVSTSGSGTIPIRTGTGKLEADTVGGKSLEYVVSANSQISGTPTEVPGTSGVLPHTVQAIPTQIVTATTTNNCADETEYVVEHGLGAMPLDVKVFEGSSTTEEVEVEVESTTTQSTVKFSPPGPSVDFTIKILGIKP